MACLLLLIALCALKSKCQKTALWGMFRLFFEEKCAPNVIREKRSKGTQKSEKKKDRNHERMLQSKILISLAQVSAFEFLINMIHSNKIKHLYVLPHTHIVLVQVLWQFRDMFGVRWPPMISQILSSLALVNFNPFQLQSVACTLNSNFVDSFLFMSMVPMAVIAMFCGIVGCCLMVEKLSKQSRPRAYRVRSVVVYAIFLALFLFFPIATSSCFKMFPCISLRDGSSWLAADLSANPMHKSPICGSCGGTDQNCSVWAHVHVFAV
jgi:hypothetical protein